jgi:hypothetical protein
MSNLLSDLLGERDPLLADGAAGTNMMAVGLPAGQAPSISRRVWRTCSCSKGSTDRIAFQRICGLPGRRARHQPTEQEKSGGNPAIS